jgi:hypothetical protein
MLCVSGTLSALQPVSVHVLALCAFCNNPVHAQVTQQTGRLVIDYTRLENMSAVIHTHAVMCLVPQASCSLFLLHVLALCAFCNNPVRTSDNRQQTAVIDYQG